MALADNHRQRATTIGRRTWFCTGTSLVVMGMVAMAAELVLQQKLNRSKFGQSGECVSQSANVKVGIWCGIPVSIVHLKMTHRPSVCLYVCMCFHACMCIYVYMQVCMCACICVCVCMSVCTCDMYTSISLQLPIMGCLQNEQYDQRSHCIGLHVYVHVYVI